MAQSMIELEVDAIAGPSDIASTSTSGYTKSNLDPDHKHYKSIVADFQRAAVQVSCIEKIHNSLSQNNYSHKAKIMMMERCTSGNPDYTLNEKYLYHGFQGSEEDICSGGFDTTYCRDGCFGKGLYFSDDVRKCLKYANRRVGDKGQIFCVRTILGEAKVYEDGKQNRTLRREPTKDSGRGFRFYCSVKGRPSDFNEFVVYREHQTLIEYLITYSKTTMVDEIPTVMEEQDSHVQSDSSSSSSDGPAVTDYSSDTDDDTDDEEEPCVEKIVPGEPHKDKIRKTFKKETKETNGCIVESFLMATNYQLDIATYLYLHRKEIEEEIKKLCAAIEAGEYQADENLTFHPEDCPRHGSTEWKSLKEDEQNAHIDNFLSIFMSAIALSQEHASFAKKYLVRSEYDIDKTIVSYYLSI